MKLISGFEKFGKDRYADIAEILPTKTLAEIRRYAYVFWQRKEELPEHDRFMKRIMAAEEKRRAEVEAQKLFAAKCAQYRDPLNQIEIVRK